MNISKIMSSLAILLVLLTGCSQSSKHTKGDNVDQQGNAYRIVPTTVALTMTLDKLDIPIVGKPTTYKTLPKRYKDVPEVGQPMQPSVEAVKQVNPTHVLSVSTIKDEMKPFYKQLNMKGYYYDYDSLDGMEKSITQLGHQFNRESKAKALNQHINSVKKDIQDKAAKQKKHPKVLILMGVPGSYLVATDKSYIGDLVKIAGGENVIKDTSKQYISSNTENLVNVDPDIILRLPHGMPDEVKKMFQKEFKQNDIWKHFKAVKEDRVYDLEEIPFGITANVDADDAMKQLYDVFYNQH
ncbi:heme ABC transporter substrate-binding protein IsdE [Staphylococcus lugdunensis]|jgi:iron complex transport system substrate-binding protein|uniref:High-affinity heme uptake system protein IsdE n=2 Tax=Staphylococcus lugdunensis TaxID=28035 RepID=A0A4Q9WB50_STALU|nr:MULTISPECIES: heme ABC transporter substrate-binding protein IsdE [Staphylococcus]AMG61728.1 heme ABC transporter substrate-binding protein IsdE [Staphylococcus lugdunensis]ARJ10241.1 heme ABC transporter substrate-binding protein IsdE [Staphylococcus lugdunensis]ARJ12792.1 heme ABC transporter substrate-binding protein IsdE [Staphylococcus lugdunensis]ARJ17621.1 heme ABC transporter substrate-binding protein IsdE [Staphylococcus lugdunensis]AST61291.1 heme ABC transporter substrate-binding